MRVKNLRKVLCAIGRLVSIQFCVLQIALAADTDQMPLAAAPEEIVPAIAMQQSVAQDQGPIAVQPPHPENPPAAVNPPGPPVGAPGLPPQNPLSPIQWDFRAGYSPSGAIAPLPSAPFSLPGTGFDHGALIGTRVFFDAAGFGVNARLNVSVGNAGLNYATLNLRAFRLRFRVPTGRSNFLWGGVAPLDIDVQGTSSPRLRNRFAYRPNGLFGFMTRLGNTPEQCVFQIFGQAGLDLLGFGQTQDNNPVNNLWHPMTGAEAVIQCRSIHVETSFVHLFGLNYFGGPVFNGVDVNRVDFDFGAQARILQTPYTLGAFLSAVVSQEYGNRRASPLDPTYNDRVFIQASTGLRLGFW